MNSPSSRATRGCDVSLYDATNYTSRKGARDIEGETECTGSETTNHRISAAISVIYSSGEEPGRQEHVRTHANKQARTHKRTGSIPTWLKAFSSLTISTHFRPAIGGILHPSPSHSSSLYRTKNPKTRSNAKRYKRQKMHSAFPPSTRTTTPSRKLKSSPPQQSPSPQVPTLRSPPSASAPTPTFPPQPHHAPSRTQHYPPPSPSDCVPRASHPPASPDSSC